MIGLGTAQWGMAYGIANTTGRPSTAEVEAMLDAAFGAGVRLIDTAPAYGDAEALLGRLGVSERGFTIVTKTKPGATAAEASAAFETSRARLGAVDTVLVHHARDLLGAGGAALWRSLQALKSAGTVARIGYSVYERDELERCLDEHPPDVVQCPVSIYDRRFLDERLLDRLGTMGVSLHARSIFLQGLLLQAPDALDERFASIREHHRALHERIDELGLTPVQACMQSVCTHPAVDRVIVGCETLQQLRGILEAAEARDARVDFSELALEDVGIINPATW